MRRDLNFVLLNGHRNVNVNAYITFGRKCCEKYVKYPVTKKHPVKKPVNFAQAKF